MDRVYVLDVGQSKAVGPETKRILHRANACLVPDAVDVECSTTIGFASLLHVYFSLAGKVCLGRLLQELVHVNYWFYRNRIGRK